MPKTFVRDVINVMLQNVCNPLQRIDVLTGQNMMEYNELSGKALCKPLIINKGVELPLFDEHELTSVFLL